MPKIFGVLSVMCALALGFSVGMLADHGMMALEASRGEALAVNSASSFGTTMLVLLVAWVVVRDRDA